jgi:hypothetical protein
MRRAQSAAAAELCKPDAVPSAERSCAVQEVAADPQLQVDAAQPREAGGRQKRKLTEPPAKPEAQPQRPQAAWDVVQQSEPTLKPKSRALPESHLQRASPRKEQPRPAVPEFESPLEPE